MRFQGKRERRIDRALSSVLTTIDREHDERLHRDAKTWADIGQLGSEMDTRRIAAHNRAKALHDAWQARVTREGN